jgi:hypothetical protein
MKMFKLKQVACVATVATGLAFGMASATAAPTIGFGAAVDNGATVSVDVVVGDLGNQIVSAYDLDVSFDTGALAFFGLTFSAALVGLTMHWSIRSSALAWWTSLPSRSWATTSCSLCKTVVR